MKTLRTVVLLTLIVATFSLVLAAQDIRTESFQGKAVASGEILVKFRGANETQSLAIAAQDADIASSEPVGQTGVVLLRSRTRDVGALLQAYASRLDVLYAEPNYVGEYFDVPNDALLGQQWGIRNTGQIIQGFEGVSGADIGASQAWDITEGSRNVVVALVDTGFDYRHPDLASNAWSASSAFTVRINGQTIHCAAGTHGFNAAARICDPIDAFGHGTHVAGIIGAAGNNGLGVTGVNRIANIIGLKLSEGSTFTTRDAIAALDFIQQVKALFPTEANIRVINASWGVPFSRSLQDEISLLNAQDILFVASAGNAATNNDLSPSYPATYSEPNIVSVAATGNEDELATFSQWGPTTVDLGAPGLDIMSTLMGGIYGFNSGTSMASPMVAGAAALVLSACPMPTAQLKATLLNSVDEVPALAQRTLTGGRLNVFRALRNCTLTPAAGFALTVSPGKQNIELNQSATFTVTATALGDYSGTLSLSASGLPAGVSATFNPPFISGSGTALVTITVGSSAATGWTLLNITGTDGSVSRTTGAAVGIGVVPSIGPGQTISGTLSPGDRRSQGIGSFADLYRLTLTASTDVTIDLKSTLFNGYLYVLSPSGVVLFASDNAQNQNPRVSSNLSSGDYLIEVTSADGLGGKYTLSINAPTISSITPRMIAAGTSSTISLIGTRFSSPMTINAGTGITVTNVFVTSPTSATATLAIAADASPGPRDLTVSTSEGTSNPMMFPVPTRLVPGQPISGTLAVTDLNWPNTLYHYSDLYQINIDANNQGTVTIDVKSTGFDSFTGLFGATGALVVSNNDGGGLNNDRIATTLTPGTYFLEVTSGPNQAVGDYVLSLHLAGLTSIFPPFIEQGNTDIFAVFGSRFGTPISVNAGADVMATDVAVLNPTAANITMTAAAGATVGDRQVNLTTPSGSTNPVNFKVIPPLPTISLGTTVTGTLSPADLAGVGTSNAYMDLYRFTLTASFTTRITITMQSTDFDPLLIVRNAESFTVANSLNDTSGGTTATTIFNLPPGTYLIEATSFLDRQEGQYQLSLNAVTLELQSISPRFGSRGTAVNVTLAGPGITGGVMVNAGPGIAVGITAIIGTTGVGAVFTIAPGAAVGPRNVTITTPQGTTNAVTFTVLDIPSISVGETKSGSLSPTDQPSVNRTGQYGDIYRLTLTTPTPVAIELKSADFTPTITLMGSTGGQQVASSARILTSLAAGTYFIDATSSRAGIGGYTLSVLINPTILNFPRALSLSDLPNTGFAIVNPGPADATVQFTMYDTAGSVVATSNQIVGARGQFAKLAAEIFPGVSRGGWVQAKSDSVGLQGMWMGGDFVNVMDGAEAAPEIPFQMVSALITPQAELHIVNLGNETGQFSIELFSGVPASFIVSRFVSAKGVLKATLAELFPTANLANAGMIRVNGSQPFTGLTVASGYPEGPSWTVLNGVSGTNSPSSATQANFPHVVSGAQSGSSASWASIVGVLNLNLQSQTLTFTFTPATGAPITVTRIVGLALRESVQSLFSLPAGYYEGSLRITGSQPITGYVAYGYNATGGAAIVSSQNTTRTSMLFAHVANGPTWGTGLALLNPSPVSAANVQVYVMRKTGALVGSATFALPAGSRVSRLLSDLVPASTADDGFVFVRTTNGIGINATQVFFSRDLRVISNVAPLNVDPAAGFQPPAQ